MSDVRIKPGKAPTGKALTTVKSTGKGLGKGKALTAGKRASKTAERKAARAPERTEAEWAAAADWAEGVVIDPAKPGVLRGADAAAFGRAVLRNARAGRPPLDPESRPGQHAPVRRVRVDTALNEALDSHVRALAEKGVKTTPSEVIRTALAAYLDTAHVA